MTREELVEDLIVKLDEYVRAKFIWLNFATSGHYSPREFNESKRAIEELRDSVNNLLDRV